MKREMRVEAWAALQLRPGRRGGVRWQKNQESGITEAQRRKAVQEGECGQPYRGATRASKMMREIQQDGSHW